MERSQTNPDDHIAGLPDGRRDEIQSLDALISGLMGGLPRTLWEGKFWGGSYQQIIGYGDLEYRRSDGEIVEWFVVGLASQKNYMTVFINGTDGDAYLVERNADRLGRAKVGKSSVSFKRSDDVDLAVLSELIAAARAQAE
jgi:hypothetical protein